MGFLLSILGGLISIIDKLVPERKTRDFGKIIKESGIGHKIIFSYQCRVCTHTFASIFQDAKTVCPKCKNISAVTITSDVGYTDQQLAEIYNTRGREH